MTAIDFLVALAVVLFVVGFALLCTGRLQGLLLMAWGGLIYFAILVGSAVS